MSLKARLRLAVAILMSAMVAVVSALYIQSYLSTTLLRTETTAKALGDQLQDALLDQLQLLANQEIPPPSTPEQAKQFWWRQVRTDPGIASTLRRVLQHWQFVSEVFITDEQGKVLTSTVPTEIGRSNVQFTELSDWSRRTLPENLRQIYIDRHDSEVRRPLGFRGENKPIIVVHIVVSSLFLREKLWTGLEDLAKIGIASLIASIVLALVLPNFVLNPLERLSRSLDLMTKGKFALGSNASQREAKEFAAVYTKLNALGQQFLGAQQDVDQLRGNVEQLLERLKEAVMLFDASGRLTMAGSAIRPLLGVDPAEISGCSVERIFPTLTELGSLIVGAVHSGQSVRDRVVTLPSGGTKRSLVVSVQPLHRRSDSEKMGTVVTLRDASTRGELAAQLDVAGRLTALSQLTRGVAHEIKNPLNAITLHLEMLRARLDEEAPELSVIAREISRLDRVVKTFLDFNRPVEPRMRLLDINDVVRDIAGLLGPDAASRRVALALNLTPQRAMVNGDRDLLKQAIMNVVMNGVEAMKGGGSMTLDTRVTNGRVEVAVRDTGPGIPREVQDKIFNLYFSTKPQGSGIGLAMAFRFVQLHDGRIDFSSEVGSGTTFRFNFPEAESQSGQDDTELSQSQRA
jgi:signal transduction histidine kinase